jgi:hypothetical protein
MILAASGCGDDNPAMPDGPPGQVDGPTQDGAGNPDGGSMSYILNVSPSQLRVRQRMTSPPLVFEFVAPVALQGRGVTTNPMQADDLATVQLELPMLAGQLTADELVGSNGITQFDPPLFCRLADTACASAGHDGYWRGELVQNGTTTPVQLGYAEPEAPGSTVPYHMVLGAFLPLGQQLQPGDHIRMIYRGSVPGLSTDWTDQPFISHCRYRDQTGPWTLLTADQVQPVQIVADPPAFVRTLAPLDVQVGQAFQVAVVVTDRYGNPSPLSGTVHLTDGLAADVAFAGEWRKEVTTHYADAGFHRIVPALDGARAIYHYTHATTSPPGVFRQTGDTHAHSGDGGAQVQFLGSVGPGDHHALYTRSRDQLRYQQQVAGHEFGTVSEHAFLWNGYTLPAAVAADNRFKPGGICAPTQSPVPHLTDWWDAEQQTVEQYGTEQSWITFPSFEWHSANNATAVSAPLHRIVLFRDFATSGGLPLLGDMTNRPPTCVVAFLQLAGFGSDQALVVPHMMQASDHNIDWDLTYAGSTTVASRAAVEDYVRVGEIFSARAYDQTAARPGGLPLLTVYEGADTAPGKWTYRYGWTAQQAHIGLIGSSDNHEQTAGVNDDLMLDGSSFHSNESSGYAVVLATAKDRNSIFDGLRQRRSYATSGVRAWLDYSVAGSPMGSAIAKNGDSVTALITLAAGLSISRVELWEATPGDSTSTYTLVTHATPGTETFTTQVTLPNPVAAGGAATERLYYVRAFLATELAGLAPTLDEAVWSSPIWITWSR